MLCLCLCLCIHTYVCSFIFVMLFLDTFNYIQTGGNNKDINVRACLLVVFVYGNVDLILGRSPLLS